MTTLRKLKNTENTFHSKLDEISSKYPDWSRETSERWWEPSKRLIETLRDYEIYSHNKNGNIIMFLFYSILLKLEVIRHRFWSVVTGADIPLNSKIDGGLILPHPNGVVIHPDAVIGPNCLLFQQVTIGCGGKPGIPLIKGHVDIGAGAKILGGITIGEHSVIGAKAVVTCNVPAYHVAIGIPAIVKPRIK